MTRNARGFSLVELMVAMTVTLIVSGAIYGLLTSGSNAFRREPEIADRQQNIRAAMDLIARDVFSAGAALPTFAQVFTSADPDGACQTALNGCGAAGAMGAPAAAGRGGDAEETDVLEIVAADEQCPMMSVCSTTQPRRLRGRLRDPRGPAGLPAPARPRAADRQHALHRAVRRRPDLGHGPDVRRRRLAAEHQPGRSPRASCRGRPGCPPRARPPRRRSRSCSSTGRRSCAT